MYNRETSERIKVGGIAKLSDFHWVCRTEIIKFIATYLKADGTEASETFRVLEDAIEWADTRRAEVVESAKPKPESLGLRLFKVEYHDGVEWAWVGFEVIAVDEAQVRSYVDAKRSPDCRHTPHRIAGEPEDSLTIVDNGEVDMPFELPQRGY
jgi:hypothetical protein